MDERQRPELRETPRLLVRVEEAAEMLSLSRSMVYELLRRGELRGTPPGGPRRVLLASVHEWVDRMTKAESS